MKQLINYIRENSETLTRHSGKDGAVDVGFFEVVAKKGADAQTLKDLVAQNRTGAFNSVDPFDGYEHGYMELGGWIGDQRLALTFMGLSAALGITDVLSPKTMLGNDLPSDLEDMLLGEGLLTICKRGENDTPAP